ncbi:MAG TPA: hypothetical protein VIT65_16850, partial [Microlunatus sp.]
MTARAVSDLSRRLLHPTPALASHRQPPRSSETEFRSSTSHPPEHDFSSVRVHDAAVAASPVMVQRQMVTPLGPGGGYGRLLERDRQRVRDEGGDVAGAGGPTTARPPVTARVCSRDLQGALGFVGNHAYVEAPPFRYAVITPLCPASKWDNVITGT